MKPVVHLSVADIELAREALWYDGREPGLGERFLKAVEETERWLQKHPALGAPHRRGTRKWRVKGFPHNVIYREEAARIVVCAFVHPKRRPGYWLSRVD